MFNWRSIFDHLKYSFVVFDFSSRLDDFIEHKMTPGEVLNFYFLYVPQMVVVVTPISLLLSIFYSLGRLCRNREILALRASGLSLMRIGQPLFIVGVVCAVTVFFINEHFVTQNRGRVTTNPFSALHKPLIWTVSPY